MPKNAENFICNNCNFKCSKLSDWNRHLNTAKHKKATDVVDATTKKEPTLLSCACGKQYKERTALWRHKKICKYLIETTTTPEQQPHIEHNEKIQISEDILLQLIQDNKDMRLTIIELAKKAGTTNNIVNNTVNNNQKFNLNMFLNETCKDAMSIKDFVKSIEVTVQDFAHTGEIGFVNGITKIMTDKISNMDIQDRPLHCTDLKRETIYIKDDEKWEKDEDKKNLRKAVKQVANKNYYTASDWMEETPNSKIMGTKEYEDFFKYANESTGGVGVEQTKSFEDKIMRNVMKVTTIDKEKAMEKYS